LIDLQDLQQKTTNSCDWWQRQNHYWYQWHWEAAGKRETIQNYIASIYTTEW